MENRNELRAVVDRARLVVKLSLIGGILALVFFTLTIAIGIVNDGFVGSDVFALGVIPCALAALFGLAALAYGLLNKSAALESEEKFLLENRKQNRALDTEEDVRFTAGRSFDNFRKYAPYVITVLAALLMALMLILFARYWNVRVGGRTMPLNSLNAALVSAIMALFSIALGAFFAGQSRVANFRWLRPLGGWLLMAAMVYFAAAVSSILNYYQIPAADGWIARVAWWAFAVLGAEFLISFVIEFYRPRTLEEPRPLFESRLLALFTEPGGVMRNAAEALDYQFGFKVSGTWIYSFIEKSLFPLLIVWAAILWLSTSVYEVDSNEIGIRERFGRVVSATPLEAGVYLELPWPFGHINRFSCSRIYEIVAGEKEGAADSKEPEYVDDGHGHAPPPKASGGKEKEPEVTLWTQEHVHGESYYIVAVESDRAAVNTTTTGDEAVGRRDAVAPISLMGLHMPVQYRIRKAEIMDYAYGNRNPAAMLKLISEQVVTEYMASCSLQHIMADSRHEAAAEIHQRIQRQADRQKLGVEIFSVNILAVHPPIEKVAPEFQAVIGAMEERETRILAARAEAELIVPDAEARAFEIKSTAEAYRYNTSTVAAAESQRFKQQLSSYLAMPEMFRLNSLLTLLERDAADIRKYILSSTFRNEVYELNFQEKERLDLLDANLGALSSQ